VRGEAVKGADQRSVSIAGHDKNEPAQPGEGGWGAAVQQHYCNTLPGICVRRVDVRQEAPRNEHAAKQCESKQCEYR